MKTGCFCCCFLRNIEVSNAAFLAIIGLLAQRIARMLPLIFGNPDRAQ